MSIGESFDSSNANPLAVATPVHTLLRLPYDHAALAPVISASTVDTHYGKHHRAYLDNLNKLVDAWRYCDLSLERIIAETAGRPERVATFNNAAQVWNHNFYWRSLKPGGGGLPPALLRQRIEASFGTLAECRKQWATMAASQFGSGWVWLVANGARLELIKTSNAEGPLTLRVRPLLTIDIWEHAYNFDYQNRRVDYVNAVFDKLINWGFAADNFG